MLRSARHLENYELQARDGSIGRVKDFYFDDSAWTVRYLVVDAGRWLEDRCVLISPVSVLTPDWEKRKLPVDLSMIQVRNSPPVDTDRPVSLQYATELNQFYGWPAYYTGDVPYSEGVAVPVVSVPTPAAAGLRTDVHPSMIRHDPDTNPPGHANDPHLRSMRHVTGYKIEATDGDIGHIEDFLVDELTWEVQYIVVDTRNWWPGKKVVISPQWITYITWPDAHVSVDLTRAEIQAAPAYNPAEPPDAGYFNDLHLHHGRTHPNAS